MKATWENAKAGDTIGREKQTHTPGPWMIGNGGQTVFGQPRDVASDQVDQLVARCDESGLYGRGLDAAAEAQANARLIAAAPELLEACKVALHAVDVALCGTPGEHYFKAVKTALKCASATSIEDNLAINVAEIKEACEQAHSTLHDAIAKAEDSL